MFNLQPRPIQKSNKKAITQLLLFQRTRSLIQAACLLAQLERSKGTLTTARFEPANSLTGKTMIASLLPLQASLLTRYVYWYISFINTFGENVTSLFPSGIILVYAPDEVK